MGTNTKKLGTLVDQIESGELVLPEIQRDFVWKRNNVLLLFDSLYRGLPIGYMLVWKAKTSVARKILKGNKKIKVGQSLDNFYGYLLDGQQRLTAIKLVKDGDDNYPLMFSLYPENEDEPDEDRFSFMTAYSAQIGHQFRSIPATCSRLNRPPDRSEATPVFYYFSDLFFLVKGDRIFLMDSPFKFIL